MRFRYRILSGALIFLFHLLSSSVYGQVEPDRIKCICIDPGHGGTDSGAVGLKNFEKDLVLKIALRVGQLVKAKCPDVKIIYTRETDSFIALDERGRIATRNHADLFLSIHTNSVDVKSVKGIETYVLGLHKTEENLKVAMKENAVIKYEEDYSVKYDGFDPNKPESYIIFSLMQNLYLGKSLELAGAIQTGLIKNTKKVDRGVRQAGYLVLKGVAMPAVLAEVGFLSNAEEERYMASKEGMETISSSIAGAVLEYKEKIEKNNTLAIVPKKQNNVGADLYYAIQIASAPKEMEKPPKLAKETVECCRLNDRFRYFVRKSATYAEIHKHLGDIRKEIKDCFIIAVHKGELITVSEAKKIEKNKNK